MTASPSSIDIATTEYLAEAAKIEEGGGKSGIERQHRNGRLTARERLALLRAVFKEAHPSWAWLYDLLGLDAPGAADVLLAGAGAAAEL